jgi:two-component system response regulator MprA
MALIGVCEDEPALRSVLVRALRSRGHEPVAASTGAEAMARFTKKRPTVMLMDIG